MRLQLLSFTACLAASTAFGQTTTVSQDTVVSDDLGKHRVITNEFKSNWFAGANAGASIFFGDHDKQMKLMDRPSLIYGLYFGRWFTPGIGVRAGGQAGKIVGLTQNGNGSTPAHSTGERYDKIPWDGYWLERQEFNYFHIHGDILFNLSNLFAGYKPDRFYQIIPYAGLGWIVSYDKPKARENTANIGILNTFRISKAFELTLDLRGASMNDRFDGELGERKEEGLYSAQVGVKYNFKKRDWDKPVTVIKHTITYDEAQLDALRDKVAQLSRDNDALRQQLADAKGKTITEIKIEKQTLAAPILVTFPIDRWTVSNEARVNLGFFAKVIKEGDPRIVYKITGYADKGTGTRQRNELLSRERANAIYNVLVNEFNVSPNQLAKDYKGGVENMYYDDPRLSRAVIVIAD